MHPDSPPRPLPEINGTVDQTLDPEPTRERQQQSADAILERIRVMHSEMVALGPRGTLRAARRGQLVG